MNLYIHFLEFHEHFIKHFISVPLPVHGTITDSGLRSSLVGAMVLLGLVWPDF